MKGHLINHFENQGLCSDNTLHVVGVYSNPVRWQSRLRIARQWIAHLENTPNVKLYLVELAHGDRAFEITSHQNPQHLQLRTAGRNQIWSKENLQNLGIRTLLPRNWKYLCTSDMDVFWPQESYWAQETMQQLQVYDVIQPWKDCLDLGQEGDVLLDGQLRPMVHTSFSFVHRLGVKKQTGPNQPYKYAHTGFAWAYSRRFWENLPGGFMDRCIIGSADHLQAWGCIGMIDHAIHGLMPESFKAYAHDWQSHAYKVTHGALGFVKTRIHHEYHGKKVNRKYRERNQIFVEHKFDPGSDLVYDSHGLLNLIGKPRLMQDIIEYNLARKEDGLED